MPQLAALDEESEPMQAPTWTQVRACCCWHCSVCPLGEVKPPCGGHGWRGGGRKVGLESVMNQIIATVRRMAKTHKLLFKRGTLDDAAIARLLGSNCR